MDQRYQWSAYNQQRYGGDGSSYMDGPPYAQHMPQAAYNQSYNNNHYSRPKHHKHNPARVNNNNYYKQPQPSAPTHWQPPPTQPAPAPPPPTFAPPAPPSASLSSKSSNNTDVVTLIVENNNLKRMIVLHMSLLQEQTDKLEKKNKQLDEKKVRIESLLAQKQDLMQQVSRLGQTIDELRSYRRRSNKRTATEDVAPRPKVPCYVETQTQTEAMQQVLVEQVQQVVEPVHHCFQPTQTAPQRKPTQNVIVTSVTELPPTTPALEHIKGRGGFNGGKKISTIILHRVHQESSSLQLQEEQEKQEHDEREHDETDQLQIDEDMQTHMEQHEQVFLQGEQVQMHDGEQQIYHDQMEGMTETVIGAEEELGAVEEMAHENINNGHMIEISDMGQVVGHIDIERLRRLGINCVKQSDREHQQQLHLYEASQPQLIQSSAEDEVVNALLQSQQSEIIMPAESIPTPLIADSPQKIKGSKYLAPMLNAEPTKKVRTFAKTRVNQVVRKLPTLESSKRFENVTNYKPMLAKPDVQEQEQKRQESEERERQLEVQRKQEQEELEQKLQQQKILEQKKREQQRELEEQQEQERQQQLMEEQLKKQQREKQDQEERAKQKEQERQQLLVQEQLKKHEEERQQQLKKQEQERQEQLKMQEQARQEELKKKEQQQLLKRQEEVKRKHEEHLKMLELERGEKKKRIQEKKRKQLMEQKKQEREQKKKIEVQKIKKRNKERYDLLREQNQKQDGKLISDAQTEVVKPTPQPDSNLEHQKPAEQQQPQPQQKQQSEPIEDEDVEETIVRRLQEHLQKEQQRMQEHLQKEQQRLQSQQQQPMVRLKRSPMDSNMGSNTNLIYPPLPQSTTTATTPSSTMTPAPTPPPTNSVSPRMRGVKNNISTTTTSATTTSTATPLTPQSSSKRKRSQAANKSNNRNASLFLTSLQPYTTRSWEDQEFHCDNEFFLEEADELLADNPSLEIPKWKLIKLPRCVDDKDIERLNNEVYELRHDKYVRDEIERKKRDARYNLEQRKIEQLRQRHNQDEVLVPLPSLPTSTFYPLPEDIEGIEFVTEVPVQAFGENMLNPHTQRDNFALPWLAAHLAATAEERAKAAAMPVATLANKKLPTTKKEATHQEMHSSYVFLKRRKRQQRR